MGFFADRALRSAKRRRTTAIVLTVLLLLPAPATIGAYVSGAADARFVLTMYLAIAGVLATIPLLLFRSAYRIRRDPYSHGLFKSRFSRYGDPREVSEEIEAELAAAGTLTAGEVKLTKNWLIYDAVFIEVLRLKDIVWVYPKSTKHSVNFIPVGTTKSLCIYGEGYLVMPLENHGATSELYELLQKQAPWAIFGYREDLADKWLQKYKQVAAEVAARREGMAAAE